MSKAGKMAEILCLVWLIRYVFDVVMKMFRFCVVLMPNNMVYVYVEFIRKRVRQLYGDQTVFPCPEYFSF